jgi:hypothetical protein
MKDLWIYLMSILLTLGSYAMRAAGDTKAAELLAQARAALGGEAKLSNVQGLSATGTYQREAGDRHMSGEITLDVLFPDKMLRTDSMSPMGDGTIVVAQGVNGEQLIRNSRTIGGGPGMVIRMASPAAGTDAEAQALRNQRAELARIAIAFLLTSPAVMPVDFSYAGEAEAEDGKADVIDAKAFAAAQAKGAGSFAVRLFLDKKTHVPLMLQYRGAAPRMVLQTQQVQGPPDPARLQRAEHDAAAAQPAPQIVDITMFLDDYRAVDGVRLPHHITRSIDGKPTEEWMFKTIKVNPVFKPDTFSGK